MIPIDVYNHNSPEYKKSKKKLFSYMGLVVPRVDESILGDNNEVLTVIGVAHARNLELGQQNRVIVYVEEWSK